MSIAGRVADAPIAIRTSFAAGNYYEPINTYHGITAYNKPYRRALGEYRHNDNIRA